MLKTFPGPGYLHSEDGVVWLWHPLVKLYIWLTISSCYGSIPLALGLIGRDGGLSTLYHSCGFACQQRVLKRDISRFSFVLRVSPRCQLLITDYVFGKKVSLIIFRHKFYQNLACGAHFQFTNHDLFEKVDWSWISWYKLMCSRIISSPCNKFQYIP